MFVPATTWAVSKTIVISAVYGGGGNSGAKYDSDYVELFNLGTTTVNITGWSVQYMSSGGTASSTANTYVIGSTGTTPVNLAPGQYFLVKGSTGATCLTTSNPACPATPSTDGFVQPSSNLAISGTGGKVFLSNTSTVLTITAGSPCTVPAQVVDFIAWGTGTNCAEGTAAGATANATSVNRNNPCTDTDNNSSDFSVGTPAPHTSASPLNVCVAPVTLTPIHTIQGATPGTSTYAGQSISTSGIVTGVRPYGFYLQARDSAADTDLNTSEGIFVYTGTGNVPASATIGTELQVTGTVTLFTATSSTSTTNTLVETEIASPTNFTVLSTGNTLPAQIMLTTSLPSPSGAVDQLSHYQSMRVTIPSFTTTQGTDGSFVESTETYTSNGVFWGTVTGVPRPAREPGLEVLDPFTVGKPSTIARFDDNPEVFQVDSLSMNGSPAALDVTSNTVLAGVNGIMDLGTGLPVLVLDATNRPTVTGGMSAVPVTAAASNEATIGDLNMERFYNATADTTGAVVLTQAAYTRRLQKASMAVRNVFLSPDILAVEEVENLQTLQDLANQISTDATAATQADPQYQPYLVQGNDTSAINVGFLIKKNTVTVTSVTQQNAAETYTPSSGTTMILNDRPPLVLRAGIKRKGASDYPITVIVNHLKSLINTTDPTSDSTRAKREKQAESLAKLIASYQSGGPVISVGDYNAFEFNDGVVDSLDIIRGIVAPASADVYPGPSTALISPALVDVLPTNVSTNTYSYVYQGNVQSLDHILATPDIAPKMHAASVHLNADFPVVFRNDATRPERTSDHDGLIAYITIPGISLNIAPAALDFGTIVAKSTATLPVTVTNTSKSAVSLTSIVASAGYTETDNCGTSIGAGLSCTINVTFAPTAAGTAVTGTLTLTDSDINSPQVVTLTGNAIATASGTTLTVTPQNLVGGTNVTMTATVTGNSTAAPTGTVTFLDAGKSIGTATLTGGTATFNTATLSVGTHSITASYGGDTVYPSSTSTPAITVTVTAPPVADFSISVANTTVILTNGQPSATTEVDVTMVNGYSQTVTFACANLPASVRCTFAPASLSKSGASTLTMTKNTTAAMGEAPIHSGKGTALTLALLGLPLLLTDFRKRMRGVGAVLGALLLALGLASMTGCGNGATTTPTGSTTVTVNATGGGVTRSANFTLTVQ